MKQYLLLLLLCLLFSLPARAGGREQGSKLPLRFIAADSVATWAYLGGDFRSLAQAAAPGTPAADLSLPPSFSPQDRVEIERLWHQFAPHFNVVGGGDDELTAPQGLPALYGFSLGGLMFQLTGQAQYADAMERALFNAATRTLTDTVATFDRQDRRAAAAVVMAAPGTVYAASADGHDLYVNLYTNCTARLRLREQSFVLDQITDMPADGGVKFRFMSLRDTLRLRLHLRMPDWTAKRHPAGALAWTDTVPTPVHIFVNGHELLQGEVNAAGYVEVERTWRSMDEIYIDFPLQPQYLRRTASATGQAVRGALALQIGPQVYQCSGVAPSCYANSSIPFRLTGTLTPAGQNVARGTLWDEQDVPQDAAAPAVEIEATPYAEGAPGTVWLREVK